jgi:hypothetical protein
MHVEHYPAESIPLEAHLEELRGRCKAVGRLQGGSTCYQEELQIFLDYAEKIISSSAKVRPS